MRRQDFDFRQWFRGRVSSEWADCIDSHLRTAGVKTKQASGALWVKKMITVLWKQFFALWHDRNEFVHGRESTVRQSQVRQTLKVQLLDLHSKREEMLQRDHDILLGEDTSSDLTEVDKFVEEAPAFKIANWIASRGPIIRKSVATAKKASISNVRTLTSFFTRRRRRDADKEGDHIRRFREPPDPSRSRPTVRSRVQTAVTQFFRR